MPTARHLRRALTAFAALTCLAAPLAACGGADAQDSAAGASAGTFDQQYDAWEAKYRSCLSDKGFELPKEPGHIDFGDRQDAYKVAENACLKGIGKPPAAGDDGPAKSEQEIKEMMLKQAQCLRDRGYDVDDPADGMAVRVPNDVKPDDLNKCLAR